MTSKEKANELIDKYINAEFNCKDCDMPFCDIGCTILSTYEAKECALIAVDEILEALKVFDITYNYILKRDYWLEVKQEIEKL